MQYAEQVPPKGRACADRADTRAEASGPLSPERPEKGHWRPGEAAAPAAGRGAGRAPRTRRATGRRRRERSGPRGPASARADTRGGATASPTPAGPPRGHPAGVRTRRHCGAERPAQGGGETPARLCGRPPQPGAASVGAGRGSDPARRAVPRPSGSAGPLLDMWTVFRQPAGTHDG